jgi:hypothetical protein
MRQVPGSCHPQAESRPPASSHTTAGARLPHAPLQPLTQHALVPPLPQLPLPLAAPAAPAALAALRPAWTPSGAGGPGALHPRRKRQLHVQWRLVLQLQQPEADLSKGPGGMQVSGEEMRRRLLATGQLPGARRAAALGAAQRQRSCRQQTNGGRPFSMYGGRFTAPASPAGAVWSGQLCQQGPGRPQQTAWLPDAGRRAARSSSTPGCSSRSRWRPTSGTLA